jgi:Holliday junction resolvasome RuvABC DNA-binding subunit
LCNAPAQPIDEIEQSTGMSSFKYRELLDYLEEDVQGVGTGTTLSLDNYFENGDDFLDAAEAAYQERAYDCLTAVDGVGEATAESIALGLAEKEGWSGGKAEMKFTLS